MTGKAAKTRGELFLDAVAREMEGSEIDGFLLREAAATLDELELLEADIRENGVTRVGARGQEIAAPSLAAIAKARVLFARLSDTLFGQRMDTTSAARSAARARWGRSG